VSRVHGLDLDPTQAGPLETDDAGAVTAGAMSARPPAAGPDSAEASVGEKVTLAHDVEAVRRLDAEFGASVRRREPHVWAGSYDATRHLLETVLDGEAAYVASMSTHIELARRQGSSLGHASPPRSPVRRRAD
jgi:hypothetical protein